MRTRPYITTLATLLFCLATHSKAATLEYTIEFARTNPESAVLYTRGVIDGALVTNKLIPGKLFCPPSDVSSTMLAVQIVNELQAVAGNKVPQQLRGYDYDQILIMRLLLTFPCGKAI